MAFQETAPGLDDLLLDLVTVIELSDHDREVAENRYRRLKPHLERPSSPLRQYLLDSASLIYPQGSMAIGATIVSGTEEDRFDVDALIDMAVPAHWSNDEALDQLAMRCRASLMCAKSSAAPAASRCNSLSCTWTSRSSTRRLATPGTHR